MTEKKKGNLHRSLARRNSMRMKDEKSPKKNLYKLSNLEFESLIFLVRHLSA